MFKYSLVFLLLILLWLNISTAADVVAYYNGILPQKLTCATTK